MKVALLLFGQPRNIDNDNVYESHKKFILDKYDTDVFCHIWKCNGEKYLVSPWCESKNISIIKSADEIINEKYKPKFLEYENERNFKLSLTQQELFNKNFDIYKWNSFTNNNNLSQLYSINKVSRYFEIYELNNEITYDFLIIARYDFIIESFPNLEDLKDDKFYLIDVHPRFPDIFFIFNPKFLPSQFTYENIDSCFEKCIERKIEPCAENLKFAQYISNFNENDIIPLNIKIKRN